MDVDGEESRGFLIGAVGGGQLDIQSANIKITWGAAEGGGIGIKNQPSRQLRTIGKVGSQGEEITTGTIATIGIVKGVGIDLEAEWYRLIDMLILNRVL